MLNSSAAPAGSRTNVQDQRDIFPDAVFHAEFVSEVRFSISSTVLEIALSLSLSLKPKLMPRSPEQ